MEYGLAPIKQDLLSSRIADMLEESIYRGQFPPGTRLIEEKIASELEVSRVPVREAIRSLEKYGLVTVNPGQGAYVTELTEEDIEDVFGVRQLLEIRALELCISNNREESAEQLQHQVDQLEDLMRRPGVSRYDIIAQDIQFDESLCRLCGNKLILELWEIVSARIKLAFSMNPFYDQSNFDSLGASDQSIVDAIRAGDEAKARSILTEHIEAARLTTLKTHREYK